MVSAQLCLWLSGKGHLLLNPSTPSHSGQSPRVCWVEQIGGGSDGELSWTPRRTRVRLLGCGEWAQSTHKLEGKSLELSVVAAVQSLSRVWLSVTPGTAAYQASVSLTSSGVCSNSCPLSWWCHPTISSSVAPFSCCLQSFLASRYFPMCQLFASGDQSIGASVLQHQSFQWIFRIDLLAVQGTLKSLLEHHS